MHRPAPEPDAPDISEAPAPGEPVDRYPSKPASHPSRLHRPVPWLIRLLHPPVPADLMHAIADDPHSRLRPSHADLLVRSIAERRYHNERRGRVESRTARLNPESHDTYDFLFAGPGEPNLPPDIFKRLRWGGVFACVGDSPTRLLRLAESFANHPGFHVETPVTSAHVSRFGVRIPGLSPTGLFFAARKTHLILPGQLTERFTYDVELVPPPRAAAPRRRFTDAPNAGYTVVKRVPEEQALLARLRHRFPGASADDLAARRGDEFPFVDTIRGKALMLSGEPAQAIFHIDRASERNNDANLELLMLSAKARELANQPGAAAERYEQIMALRPGVPTVELEYSRVLIGMGRAAEVRPRLRRRAGIDQEQDLHRIGLTSRIIHAGVHAGIVAGYEERWIGNGHGTRWV